MLALNWRPEALGSRNVAENIDEDQKPGKYVSFCVCLELPVVRTCRAALPSN